MTPRHLLAAAALLALGFGAGAWWMHARLAPEIAELEAAAARSMVADLAALSGAVPGPALPAEPRRAASTASTGAAAASPAPPREAVAAVASATHELPFPGGIDPTTMSQAEYARAVTDKFANEAPDLEWKRTTEGKLTDHFYRANPLGEGATLDSVECKASVCRVLASSHEQDQERVLGPRATIWGDMVAFYTRADRPAGDAPLRVEMYLAPTAAPRPRP